MSTLYRNHAISPVIKLKIRLLQMDVLKSDRVYFRYTIKNGDKSALYVNTETAFTYMLSHCKPNYEIYYKGKEFVLETTKVEKCPRYLRHGHEYGSESHGFKKHGDPNRKRKFK
jgi:hypothetical protein